jgi:Uma2 family endonuclease
MGVVRAGSLVPALASGDRLTRAEFERRYRLMPGVKKAELIDGVVFLGPSVSIGHATAHSDLGTWLGLFKALTPGAAALDNGTVRLDDDNEPQPDLALTMEGGRAQVDDDGYLSGAPAIVVEVSLSSRAYDLHQKKEVYRRHGVDTYIVYQVEDQRVRWFELVDGRYVERDPDPDGVHRSTRFSGLWLDVQALARKDLAGVLATLQRGVAAR